MFKFDRGNVQPLGGALLSRCMRGTSEEDKKEKKRRKTCFAHYEVNFLKWVFIMKNKMQHLL